ncbi:MAG TPA: SAM-dependent methyltransferase [Arenicellales bacterium]|nr:SAM-dependent methyltransferase [Arenicellales bacterium]
MTDQTANPAQKRVWSLLLFIVIVILLAPLFLIGVIAYLVKLKTINQPRGVSGTAYEPFFTRAMAHGIGARSDLASYRLARTLPALSPLIADLIIEPLAVATRLSGHVPKFLGGGHLEQPRGAWSLMNLRHSFFDDTLTEAMHRVQQIVILGSGWDSRAYEQLCDWGRPIFEVDMPATLQAKIDALDQAGIGHSHVRFVETDFNQISWLDALKAQGFNPDLPTYILWEGVTMYLSEEAVTATLKNVSELAPGSMIAFDYFSGEFMDGEGIYKPLTYLVKISLKLTYNEEFSFGIPMRPIARDAVTDFLHANGLTLGRFDMLGEDGGLSSFSGFAVGERR